MTAMEAGRMRAADGAGRAEWSELGRRMRAYWDAEPEKIRVHGAKPGSAAYLDAIIRHHRLSHACSEDLAGIAGLKGRRVLDIYCGVGVDAVDAAAAGAEATFAAVTPAHAAMTQAMARRVGAPVSVVVADPNRLPFPDGAFDAALVRGALMFNPDPARGVSEIARVLAPGGSLLAVFYNRWSWYPLLSKLTRSPMLQPRDPPYLRLDTAAAVAGLFAGFRDLTLRYGRPPRPLERPRTLSERLFNGLLVPCFELLPQRLARRAGFYIIACGRKP